MPEPSNDASLQRRANWVGLRTLRQRPKLVGSTADGDPVYEVRSVRMVLRGLSPHFDRLAPCARCGKELAAAPVLTVADLERPLRPAICTDCVKGTGVSTVWETPAARPADAKAEVAEPALAVAAAGSPAAAAAGLDGGRLDSFERHLRVVTDRVNELGKVLWALRSEGDERRREDAAFRSALARLGEQVTAVVGVGDQVNAQRSELAAVLSAIADLRSDLHRLSDANRDLERRLADVQASAASPSEDLASLVVAQEALERRVTEAEGRPPPAPAPVDRSEIERVVAPRLADVEGRLADQRAGLEAAIEASMKAYATGFGRAHQELADSQAAAVERLDLVAAQLAQVTSRMDAIASWVEATNTRLDALEERTERAMLTGAPRLDAPRWEPPAEHAAGAGTLLETLDRQLQDAASRLAARSHRAPAEELGRGL